MGRWLKMALLLCLVTAGASVALSSHPATSEQFHLIADATELLNFGMNGSVFRLLYSDVRLDANLQQLYFTIKETKCLMTEEFERRNIEDCDFKDGGIVKTCSVYYPTEQEARALVVTCDTVQLKRLRVKRSRNGRGVRERGSGGNMSGGGGWILKRYWERGNRGRRGSMSGARSSIASVGTRKV